MRRLNEGTSVARGHRAGRSGQSRPGDLPLATQLLAQALGGGPGGPWASQLGEAARSLKNVQNYLGQKGEPHFYKMKQISYLLVTGSFFEMSFVSV